MAITKKFEVEVVKNRKLTERTYTRVDLGNGRSSLEGKEVVRTVPVSFMVYSPNGTSVWFESKEEAFDKYQMDPNQYASFFSMNMEEGMNYMKN